MPTSDQYGALIAQDSATANVAASAGVPSGTATAAIANAPVTGVPADVAMHAPQDAATSASTIRDNTAIQASPAIRDFAASSSANFAAARDDLPALSDIETVHRAVFPQGAMTPLYDIAGALGATWQNIQTEAQRNPWATQSNPTGFAGSVVASALLTPLAAIAEPIARWYANAPEGSGAYYTHPLLPWEQPKYLPDFDQRVQSARDQLNVIGAVLGLFGGEGAVEAPKGPVAPTAEPLPPSGPAEFANGRFNTTNEGHVADAQGRPVPFATQRDAAQFAVQNGPNTPQIFDIAQGEGNYFHVNTQSDVQAPTAGVPEPGVHEGVDKLRAALADLDAQQVERVQDTIAASSLHSTLPTKMEEFLENMSPGQTVAVDPEKLIKLAADGYVPFTELTPEVARAAAAGEDVQVPLSRYLTATAGQPFAKELNAATTFRDGGTSVEQAAQAQPQPSTVIPPTTVQPPGDLSAEEQTRAQTLSAQAQTQLAESARAQRVEQLFDPKALGLTQAQVETYSKRVDSSAQAATDKMHRAIYAQILRERTPEWKAEVESLRPTVEREVADKPAVQARAALMNNRGPQGERLSTPSAKFALDDQVALAGRDRGLPPKMFAKKGLPADVLAEQYSYESGHELVADLVKLEADAKARGLSSPTEHFKALVREATEDRARETLDYDLSPANIRAAASEAMNSPSLLSFVADELKDTAASLGTKFDRGALELQARQNFETKVVKDVLNIQKLERAVARTADKAAQAALKGNPIQAFRWRQMQFQRQLELVEAHGFAKEFAKLDKRVGRWAKEGKVVAGTDPNVGAILQRMAQALHYPLARDAGELDRFVAQGPYGSGQGLVAALNANGYPTYLAGLTTEQAGVNGPVLRQLTVEQFRQWNDMLATMAKYGQDLSKVNAAGRKSTLDAVANEVQSNANDLGRHQTPQQLADLRRSAFRTGLSRVKTILVGNLRPEVYLHWLDKSTQGALMNSVVNPLMAAKHLETDLVDGWIKAMKSIDAPKVFSTMGEKVPADPAMKFQTLRGPVDVIQTRGDLRAALLHLGSESARDKLLRGFGWGEEQERWLLANATDDDWSFARAFWDENDKLFKLSDAMYMRHNGVGLTKDPARMIDTGRGVIRGGHIHIQYNGALRAISKILPASDGELVAAATASNPNQGNVLDTHPASALPSSGYKIARTNYVAPVQLDYRMISSGVAEMVHDIVYREPLAQAQKVLTDPRVREALQSVLGPEYDNQMMPWLKYIAQERMLFDASTEAGAALVRGLTSNIVFGKVAFNLSSALKHSGVGVAHMLTETGRPLALAKAATDLMGTGEKARMWRAFVQSNSGEVRGLTWNNDASLRDGIGRDALVNDIYHQYKQLGYYLFTMSKSIEAHVTWLANYRQEVAASGEHEAAVNSANKSVRDTQGAGAPVDLAPNLRHGRDFVGEAGRSVVGTLMGFRNTAPNRLFTIGRLLDQATRQLGMGKIGDAAGSLGQASTMTLGYVVMSAAWLALFAVYIRGQYNPKHSPEENALREFGWGLLDQTAGSLVGLSQIENMAHYGASDSGSMLTAPEAEAMKALDPKAHDKAAEAMMAAGELTGAVPDSFAHMAQSILDGESGPTLKPADRGLRPFAQRALLSRNAHYERTPSTHRFGGLHQ